MHQLIRSSSKPLWKKLGERAAQKAVSTFVEEGIKAVIELWKERRQKEMDMEFEEQEKARREDAADGASDDSEADAAMFEW